MRDIHQQLRLVKLKVAAEQGDALSQGLYAQGLFNLGVMYSRGEGIRKNMKEAARLYTLAANLSNVHAQVNLGVLYSRGIGVKKDVREAARLYTLASDNGDAQAQFHLGVMYLRGEGVEKDLAEAARLCALTANSLQKGDAQAQFSLGVMYSNGEGVKKDTKEAARLYALAADQGDAQLAQFSLELKHKAQVSRKMGLQEANAQRLQTENEELRQENEKPSTRPVTRR
jgi:TPR repeat protein